MMQWGVPGHDVESSILLHDFGKSYNQGIKDRAMSGAGAEEGYLINRLFAFDYQLH